ncbi:hypothetical protein [Streptomyces sp. NRRL WC-3742]|uniref:hypothetical protein n=1 Tax=Streptomyces sp. NRRL WC-3742 TaxID=1463934 RepID=UPI00131E9FB7|nr:hypothetical protein [Streptomyces sp. NRRL WC-3742]
MTHLISLIVIISIITLINRSRRAKTTVTHGNLARVDVDFDAAAYGLAPRERLDSRRSGPPAAPHVRKEQQAVADAAWAGDWRAAAAYVQAAGTDWDERWFRLELLDSIADEDESWVKAWRAGDPGDCDAAALEASRMVSKAWEIRGSKYANEVPEEDMNTFRAMLPAAIEAAKRASLLDPANPAPWVVMLTAARGAQYQPEQFEELWKGLVERAPHHYAGHTQGLQYWCAKWFGTDKKMTAFAEQALDTAPAGSPLAGIYLYGLSELEERGTLGSMTSDDRRKRLMQVAASLAQVRPDDHRLAGLRHLLAAYAGQAGLYQLALEQFRAIGPWCGARAWSKGGDDPVVIFEIARAEAVRRSGAAPLPPELRPKAAL